MAPFRAPPNDQLFYIIRESESETFAYKGEDDQSLVCIFSTRKLAEQLKKKFSSKGEIATIEWQEIVEIFPEQFQGILFDCMPGELGEAVLFKDILQPKKLSPQPRDGRLFWVIQTKDQNWTCRHAVGKKKYVCIFSSKKLASKLLSELGNNDAPKLPDEKKAAIFWVRWGDMERFFKDVADGVILDYSADSARSYELLLFEDIEQPPPTEN